MWNKGAVKDRAVVAMVLGAIEQCSSPSQRLYHCLLSTLTSSHTLGPRSQTRASHCFARLVVLQLSRALMHCSVPILFPSSVCYYSTPTTLLPAPLAAALLFSTFALPNQSQLHALSVASLTSLLPLPLLIVCHAGLRLSPDICSPCTFSGLSFLDCPPLCPQMQTQHRQLSRQVQLAPWRRMALMHP